MRKNLLTGVILLVALLPLYFVWTADYLPFIDYPNHLAGVKIMRSYDSVPFYREYFSVHFLNPLPVTNMVFDFFAVKLLPLVPEDIAGRIFLSLYVLLSLLSVLLLSRETGSDTDASLLGYLPVLYGFFFQSAFMNFLFSIPLVFLAIAALLRFEKNGNTAVMAGFLCLCILVYLSHIFSFLVLALLVLLHLPWAGIKTRKVFPPVVLLVLLMVGAYLRMTDVSFRWHPLGLSYKFHIMPLYLLTYPLQYFDGLLGDLCLALYVSGLCWLLFFSHVKQKSFLFAAAALFFLYLLFPFSGARGTLIDVRLLPFASLLLLVSLGTKNRARLFVPLALFAVVVALKLYGSLSYYSAFSREFPKVMTCMEEIPDKSAVFPVVSIEGSNINPYTNSWGYLVLKKNIVTPYIFAGGQQPLGLRGRLFAPPELWGYKDEHNEPPSFWRSIRKTYSYLLLIGQNETLQRFMREMGTEQCRTPLVSLYRVKEERERSPGAGPLEKKP